MTYLCGRIHCCTSIQQLLDQVHVALLGCQVQCIKTILEKDEGGQVRSNVQQPNISKDAGQIQMEREGITSSGSIAN